MSNMFPPKFITLFSFVLLLSAVLAGCSHSKTNRGHLFRGDWAFEYNRTPWIGLPPDSGCPEDAEDEGHGLFDCLKKDNDRERKGFRRHCGMNAQCTAQNPCCRTLGCGMWVDPANPAALASLGGTAKACGLTPFCTPQKPCRLTPNCGKPINININPQSLLPANQNIAANGAGMSGMTGSDYFSGNGMMPSGMGVVRGMSPQGAMPNGTTSPAMIPGSLVSRGIVPGASAITTGGLVAAIGVSTPAGTMTPVGVRMPNGMVSNGIVLRACAMTPNCTAAHPCGLTPNCGGAVAVNLVANNAAALASALQTQGTAVGMTQTGGMGMLVNPMTNQPINGLSMSGYAQAGYPPIGYAPTGYAPGHPRFAAGNIDQGAQPAEENETLLEEETEGEAMVSENRSTMPVPGFHPIPSKPAFQRSEGMLPTPKAQRALAKPTTTAQNQPHVSEEELENALDQAYLEGVSAAMSEVERKLEHKRQLTAKAQLEEKILRQTENVQEQLEEQDRVRQLVLQREQQIRQQQAAQMQPEALVAEVMEPQRLSAPKRIAAPQNVQEVPVHTIAAATQSKPAVRPAATVKHSQADKKFDVHPVLMAKNLRSLVVGKMNDALAPLLGANEQESVPIASSAMAKERAITPPNLPGKPSVLSHRQNLGLLPESESETSIQQARFTEGE